MTLANEDMNRILDYLTRNDQELVDGSNKMENFQQDGLMVGICALSWILGDCRYLLISYHKQRRGYQVILAQLTKQAFWLAVEEEISDRIVDWTSFNSFRAHARTFTVTFISCREQPRYTRRRLLLLQFY